MKIVKFESNEYMVPKIQLCCPKSSTFSPTSRTNVSMWMLCVSRKWDLVWLYIWVQSNSASHDSLEQDVDASTYQNGRLLEPWSSFSTSLRRHRRSQTCAPDLEPGLMSDLLTGSRDTRRPYENRQIRVKRIHGPKDSVMLSQKLNILFHAFVPMWMPCVPRKWDLVHKIKESEREKERQQQTP